MNQNFDNLVGIQEASLTRATEILENTTHAQSIPPAQWIPIADNVHLLPAFLKGLLKQLNTEEKQFFVTALALSNTCEGDPYLFWTTLYQESKSAYGKAVVLTAQTFEYPIVVRELAAILQSQSHQQKGIYFEMN